MNGSRRGPEAQQRDLRLGVIGMNEGNGHPFSYSAIFNGYDPQALQQRCPFDLIREYLPRDHRNEMFLPGAKVTHVWTQDRKLSEDVAAVAKIPNIAGRMEDLVGEVDAIILARDDPENHLAMAKPFLERKMPILIDKQLAASKSDVDAILSLAGAGYPIMAGSPARYTRDLVRARETLESRAVHSIHGMSLVNWVRYGHHLFEPIACLYGLDIRSVRSLSAKEGHDIVQIAYRSGLNVILEFIRGIHIPVAFTCFSEEAEPLTVPFSDFFYSFRAMLSDFVDLVRTGKPPFPREEMVAIAHVVLAGVISKERNGVAIDPVTLAEAAR